MLYTVIHLTHCSLMIPYRAVERCHAWSSLWLAAFSAPSHYVNQWWLVAISTLQNKLKKNVNQNCHLRKCIGKMSSAEWKLFFLCPNVLIKSPLQPMYKTTMWFSCDIIEYNGQLCKKKTEQYKLSCYDHCRGISSSFRLGFLVSNIRRTKSQNLNASRLIL